MLQIFSNLLINLTLRLLFEILLVHDNRLVLCSIRIITLLQCLCETGLLIELVYLLVDVRLIVRLVKPVIEVRSEQLLLVPLFQVLNHVHGLRAGLGKCFFIERARISLLILGFLCLAEETLELLDLPFPRLHGHLLLLLLEPHLVELLLRVNVLLQETRSGILYYNERRMQVRIVIEFVPRLRGIHLLIGGFEAIAVTVDGEDGLALVVLDLTLLGVVFLIAFVTALPLILRLLFLALPTLLIILTAIVSLRPLRLILMLLIGVMVVTFALTKIVLPILLSDGLHVDRVWAFALLAALLLIVVVYRVYEVVEVLLHLLILALFATVGAGA